MLASIARVVEQFKQSWSEELEDEAIHAACQEAGHRGRDRKLDPVTTVRLFLLQIRCGNAACNHVPRLAGMKLTGSASCEARGRLPLEVLQTLLTRCTSQMSECVRETGRWRGQRLFMTDGSSFSMPDTEELREHFGQPGGQKKGCGFPTAHWLALVHFGSGLMQKVLATPLRSHDLAGVAPLHAELEADDVLLGDRAFCSFAHLETCFAHIKTTMKMDVLRCQTVRGVLKELTMFLLVYNLIRMVMLEASKRQKVPVDGPVRNLVSASRNR